MPDPSDVFLSTNAEVMSSPKPESGLRQLVKCLWTHNPFYLVSLALVLHSTRLWHHDSIDVFNPWPLMSIIGCYLMLVAVTGFLLIKLGRVWDDARSIFLVILLLFVELSLIFDSILIRDLKTGTMLLLTGWSAAVTVSECMLRGLRMQLPWTYRGPYHLLLAIMFLYPLYVVSGPGGTDAVVWRIFWFSPAVAIALLWLLPAIHRGRTDLIRNGTPWNWPWYPWTLFGFLAICLSLRAWALTLSFDPVTSQGLDDAMRMQGIFGCYFLVPVALASGILLIEAGIVERQRLLNLAGLATPLICLFLALPFEGGSGPYMEFRSQFAERFGSPFWVTLNICWIFYAYAMIRGVNSAIAGLLGTAIAIMVAGRLGHNSGHALGHPAFLLSASAGIVVLRGWQRSDSRIFVAGLLGLYLAGRELAPQSWNPLFREAIAWNLFCAGILFAGLAFQDRSSRSWQRIGSILATANCALAAILPAVITSKVQTLTPLTYCLGVTIVVVTYAWMTRQSECRSAALACMSITVTRVLFAFADLIKTTFHWDGALYFVVGIATFLVAVVISMLKSSKSPETPDASPGPTEKPPATA
jgi:hypothetical protein